MQNPGDLRLLVRSMNKLYDQCMDGIRRKHGLSQIEIIIVSFLHNNPSRDTAGDIALFRMRPKGNVTQGVDSLIQKRLLARFPDEADRRKIHLKLTERALPIVEEIDRVQLDYRDMMLKGFTGEEIETFFALNRRLMKNIMDSLERGSINEQ